jgi:hypothetical protein
MPATRAPAMAAVAATLTTTAILVQ